MCAMGYVTALSWRFRRTEVRFGGIESLNAPTRIKTEPIGQEKRASHGAFNRRSDVVQKLLTRWPYAWAKGGKDDAVFW